MARAPSSARLRRFIALPPGPVKGCRDLGHFEVTLRGARSGRAGAGRDNPIPIGQVAERRGIPVQFLEQLFSTLRRAGILISHRGAKGGYTLARPADEINVLEVVQALDGVLGQEGKEAGGIWEEGVEALRATFRSTTIADIARREAEGAGAGMYHI